MPFFVVVGECGGGGKIHQFAPVQMETNQGQYFCKTGALLYQFRRDAVDSEVSTAVELEKST